VRGLLEPPFWVTLPGSLGFVLILAGVVSQFFPEPAYHRRFMQVAWYLPQILVLMALVTFFTGLIQERLNTNEVRTALLLFALMAPMVLGRQFIIEQQNHRMTKELMNLNSTLEARIKQRSNELEASRNQLIAAERLASLGQLTAGLAHEVNTPLAAAMTSFMQANELALEYRDSIGHANVTDADHHEIAAELVGRMQGGLGSLDRIGEIVRHMRNQTRQQIDGKTRLNLTAVLSDTLSLLQHSAQKARVLLSLETPEQLTWYGEAGRISQVITNLVMNAIHACEDASVLEPSRAGQVTVRVRASDDAVLLEVQDNGVGIPESIRDRIFEPLFSSKEAGRGTGLGLPIVRDIISSHFAGTLEFDSITGHGTTFRVRLPQAATLDETTREAVLT
jgi:signal transduction histidine kinase